MSSYSINSMREDVADAYDGPSWKNRVWRMEDEQIIALWYSFKEKGKFNKKPIKAQKVHKKSVGNLSKDAAKRGTDDEKNRYEQLTFEELMR